MIVFMGLTLRIGIHVMVTGRAGGQFSIVAVSAMVAGIVSVISFISIHYYELPTHHCPFCLLQKEYHYIGYPLYLSLFAGGIAGGAVGVLERLRGARSLHRIIPGIQKRLCTFCLLAYLVFGLIAIYPIVFRPFRAV